MFKCSCGSDQDTLTDVVCTYVAFCRDMFVKLFPNSKPWVNKSVKSCMQEKRHVFKQGSGSELHEAIKVLKFEIFKAKQSYLTKLERRMAANKLGSFWSSMKTITGLQNQGCGSCVSLEGFDSDKELANALSCFCTQFESFDFTNMIQELQLKWKDIKHFEIAQKHVENVFHLTKVSKAQGSDNICDCLLKKLCKRTASHSSQNF